MAEAEIEIRADAGFAVPALYDYCEAESITYTVGLITNARLEGMAEDLLSKAKESHEEIGEKARLFSEGPYAAASWEHERRVVYKAEAMEKSTNTRFVVSTRTDGPKDLYEFYAKRGESENWIKDLKVHMKADRLSCHRFSPTSSGSLAACRGLLAHGCPEEEAGPWWGAADAARQLAASAHKDRRQGQGTAHEGPSTPGVGTSWASLMARPLGSFRSRS